MPWIGRVPLVVVAACAAVTGAAALAPATAAAAPCALDRTNRFADKMLGTGSWSAMLACNGTPLQDMPASFAPDGSLSGVSWTEHDGDRRRTTYIHANGQIYFIVQDTSIQGGFSKQTRSTGHYLFPRSRPITVSRDARSGRVVVRDGAGRAWHLAPSTVERNRITHTSYRVLSIDDHEQPARPIDFTKRGIVAVDLIAPYALYLDHVEPNMHGLADRRSRQYLATKSIFHDGRGHTCAVPNSKLFQPRGEDPNDRADYELRFADDGALADFLAAECPTLDLKVLGVTALAR